jgi:hypothetical protein
MRSVRAVAAATVAAAALLTAGCSVEVGDVQKIPRYVAVEAPGVRLDVLDGMVAVDVRGYDAFWQNHGADPQVSVGVVTAPDEGTFAADQLDALGGVMSDFTSEEADGGAVAFEGTGVDDARYRGLVAVRDGVGVVISAGEGIADGVLRHVVDSVHAP